jgi:hypothetical protein
MTLYSNNIIPMNAAIPSSLETLRRILSKIPAGCLSDEASALVRRLLANCWDDLKGSDVESTWSNKLSRAEELQWNSPYLKFTLERHGGTVNGSTRAALHTWTVDVENATASVNSTSRYRQIEKRAAPFTRKKAIKLSEELTKLICQGAKDDRLKWHTCGSVTVRLSRCIDAAFNITRAYRNRTLRSELTRILSRAGWKEVPGSVCRFKPALRAIPKNPAMHMEIAQSR